MEGAVTEVFDFATYSGVPFATMVPQLLTGFAHPSGHVTAAEVEEWRGKLKDRTTPWTDE